MKLGIERRLMEKIPEVVAVESIPDEETSLELNEENIEEEPQKDPKKKLKILIIKSKTLLRGGMFGGAISDFPIQFVGKTEMDLYCAILLTGLGRSKGSGGDKWRGENQTAGVEPRANTGGSPLAWLLY
ncbi:unnamed protein product [Fraxinus pennsylvanica]|uniref:Uncharacterized protein n=1 Tax=Fraxinus pennsylvanica TaxID=56036 RepID=A0AAD1Z7F4_9LAMI|nr:unnamed protein product [Fraxinus pennsylvanica]